MQATDVPTVLGLAEVLAPSFDLAAVAELMEPAEQLIPRPDVTLPARSDGTQLLLLSSPNQPADDPEDD